VRRPITAATAGSVGVRVGARAASSLDMIPGVGRVGWVSRAEARSPRTVPVLPSACRDGRTADHRCDAGWRAGGSAWCAPRAVPGGRTCGGRACGDGSVAWDLAAIHGWRRTRPSPLPSPTPDV
jgi:hypothetical protein